MPIRERLQAAIVTNVTDARYRVATILAAVVVLIVLIASICYLPQPWAIDLVKMILLGAVGVVLVVNNNTNTK